MAFDVARVRALYPALADGYAYLDGAAGTQVPESVVEAVASAYRMGLGNVHGAFPASSRSDTLVAEARAAAADLVGAPDPAGVALGPSMTALTYRMSGALAKTWFPGDEVVVTRLDHDANIRPWVQAAERAGAVVRWAEPDLVSGELPVDAVTSQLSPRTRVLAVTAASNVLGTRPDLPAISAAAHDVGALVYVDGVHLTPHAPVSMADLGADFYATSSYKWSGPHVAAVAADPALLDRLHPDKLASSPDAVPERFERGTSPFADLAGMAAAVDHLADLDDEAAGTRRERVLASMTAVEAYEQELFAELLAGLEQLPGVRLYGWPARRTATAFFRIDGRTPLEVAEHLAAAKVNVWAGHMYAWELTGALGIRDDGGAVRAGLVHYNDSGDVEALLAGLAELT